MIVPDIDEITDFTAVEDAVFECRGDEETDSLFDTVATVERVGEDVSILDTVALFVNVVTDVSEVDKVDVYDDRGVILNAAVVVASVDCDTLEVTDNEKRGVVVARALLDEVEEKEEEPEVLLLNLLDSDVNTERETEGDDVSLRDGRRESDNFAVTEFDDDNLLLPLIEGDTVIVLDKVLDMEARVVDESCADNVCVPLIIEESEFVTEIELVRE